MAHLAVSLLGLFQVTLDGKPVTGFESAKERALLAYLAVEADRRQLGTVAHRRETLAGLLWPDWPDRSARTNLRNALSTLRAALGDRPAPAGVGTEGGMERVGTQAHPYLLVDRETVQLNPAADCWVDVQAFREWTAAGQSTEHLEEGIALYRGPFLEGFGLKDSAPFEEWVLAVREQLQRQRLDALGRLSDQYEGRGELDKACAVAWRQVDLAPWLEEAHRRVMRLLALSGQRGAALAQYEACRRALRDELGVEPSADTVALYEDIRSGEIGRLTAVEARLPARTKVPVEAGLSAGDEPPAEAGPLAGPASSPMAQPLGILPVSLTPFVGRQELLAEIQGRLEDPACRLLTLVGPGGSGKTRLAVEAARAILATLPIERPGPPSFPHGVHFVPLAPLQAPEAIVPAVAQALGFPFHGQEDPQQQLLNYLRQKGMLLVLDNCEHLLARRAPDGPSFDFGASPEPGGADGAGMVGEILRAAPAVKVLVTSRVALNVQGEQLLPVPGMSYPALAPSAALRAGPVPCAEGRGDPDDPLRYSAVQLFVQSAQQVRPGFQPAAGDLARVVEVCRLVQGIPLAVLLAAAWMRLLSPAEIAAQIASQVPGQSLDFLEGEWHDVPGRQRSMRAVFDHSWRLLTPREQTVFAALAVFRGGCTYTAAQEVTGATLRELMVLANSSLLQRTLAGRYEVHELLRQYAEERLDQTADGGQGARDRHVAHYAAALGRWATELKGPQQQQALAEMDVEMDNVRAGWGWAVAHRRVERLREGMEALGGFCFYRWRCQEGETMFRAAADALARAGPPSTDRLLARVEALAWQGQCAIMTGRGDLARHLLGQSLELLTDPALAGQDVRRQKAFALLSIGFTEFFYGDCGKARPLAAQSLSLSRELDDPWATADALYLLGLVNVRLGEPNEAKRWAREGLSISRTLGAPLDIASHLQGLANVCQTLGELDKAERLGQEAIAVCRELGDSVGLASALYGLGLALYWSGRQGECLAAVEESLAIHEALGIRGGADSAQMLLGLAHLLLGQYDRAGRRLQMGLAVYQEFRHWMVLGETLRGLGGLALAQGQVAEADRLFQESVGVLRDNRVRSVLGWALACLGIAALCRGERDRARESLGEALRLAVEIRDLKTPLWVLPAVALFAAETGHGERAVELWALASRYPFVAHSPFFHQIIGRDIEAVAATLPPEVVAAAQERGRARDLEATVQELLAELTEAGSP